ncbi:exonuclease [Natronosalvus vescus]|uniref:exonuclease n=1 Tax=Natronosalvus vescus TaxID=2953881 RepID=UPI0020915B66|nr:exonuclease [Natronosalvus vescus]
MATEGRVAAGSTATSALESADFVHIVTLADGDGLAAAGLLARTLSHRETPFQVTTGRTIADRTTRLTADDRRDTRSVAIAIGPHDVDDGADELVSLETHDRPASLAAAELARDLGSTPDPLLTLAGTVAAGLEPGAGETEWLLEAALEKSLLERRPGVAVPTTDVIDGLAHTAFCRAPWSGDVAAVRTALEDVETNELDADGHRTIGSVVALDVVGAEDAIDQAAASLARFLHPYAIKIGADDDRERSFATLGGYADVLEATAAVEPATGVALAMGHDARKPALDAWQRRGKRAHVALDGASTGRYDGLYVLGVDEAPLETVARLALAYRSPESTVLVVGTDGAAIATREPRQLGSTLEAIARDLELGGAYDVGHRGGILEHDGERADEAIIAAVREHL